MKTYKFITNYLYAGLTSAFGVVFKKIAFLLAFPLPSSAQTPMTFKVLKNFKLLFLFALLGFGVLLAPTSHSQETDNLNFQSPGAADPIQGLMKKGFPGVSAAIQCQQMPPHTNSLTPFATETGMISLSTDAAGTNTTSGTVRVKKPAGAMVMVRKAYLLAATQPKDPTTINIGDITINGAAVTFTETQTKTNCLFAQGQLVNNYWGDVTSLVETTINGANAGEISIDFTESAAKTVGIDGVILVVIFDDPNQITNNTVKLFFGGQNPTGDNFTVDFGDPINKDAPNFALDMSLGISFGHQARSRQQFSEVNVNGARLTSSAGGEDDSRDSPADDGALITVGGFGGLGDDSNNNPVPTAPPNGRRSDDELYDLKGFVSSGNTSVTIATTNPPNDDNIFFAAFFIGNHREVPPPTRTISGRITNNGNGLSGVSVALTGSNSNIPPVMTNNNGDYSISGIPSGGNYTVTPSLTNFTFDPPNRTYNNLSANQTAQNYTATSPCVYDIDPKSANVPASGGTFSFNIFTNPGCAWQAIPSLPWITTTSSGTGNGTIDYTVAPNTSAPRPGTITVGGKTFTVNQAGILAISGRITNNGNGLSGVSVALTGSNFNAAVTTNANGDYSISNIPSGGNYTVTPSLTNFAFTPTNQTYNNLSANQIAQNYTAISTCEYRINPTSANISLDAGTYSFNIFTNAGCEWRATTTTPWITTTSSGSGNGTINYTVTANTSSPRPGTIMVGGKTFDVNQAGVHAISGRITSNGNSLSGVTVALTGSNFNTTVMTNSNGDYFIFNVPSGGNYTVTPSLTSYIFDPPSRTYDNLSSEQPFQDFNATFPCSYTISPTSASVLSSAGTSAFKLFTNPVCSWNAVSNIPWITTTSSGMGSGTVIYTVAANTNGVSRMGTITVGGQTFTVNQNDTENTTYSISGRVTIGTNGFLSGITIVAEGPITRTTITNSNGEYELTGVLPGTYEVRPILAGATFKPTSHSVIITNSPVSDRNFEFDTCIYSLSSPGIDVSAGTTSKSFNVSTAAGCEWRAVSNVRWIIVANEGIGIGNAPVNYFVQRNYGAARAGTIVVNGQLFTVRQEAFQQSSARNDQPDAAICKIDLINVTEPSDNTRRFFVPFTGAGNLEFRVVTESNCQWDAKTLTEDWIKITEGENRSGNNTLAFSVLPNDEGNPRFGKIVVNEEEFQVIQRSKQLTSCNFALNPTGQEFPNTGGNDNFRVEVQNGCTWSAFTKYTIPLLEGVSPIIPAPFVKFDGFSDRGNRSKTTNFIVDPNLGPKARIETIIVGDKDFTVNQAKGETADCEFRLSPSEQTFAAVAGTGSFMVSTETGCEWTASKDVSWITITGGSGNDAGTVSFTVEPNPNTTVRPGTITVADQTYRITQAGSQQACSYTIDPGSQTVAGTGAAGNIKVTAQTACPNPFIAAQDKDWITITEVINQSNGSGSVKFVAETNDTTFERTGNITVAGQTFTITQAAGTSRARAQSRFDFDGDGKADLSVFRPSDKTWFIKKPTAGFSSVEFGLATDKLVPADYDGDGRTDIAVFRPTDGVWYRLNSANGQFVAVQFGQTGDVPVPGDYDGDGRDDQAVYRAGTWFLNRSQAGFTAISFGLASDKPVPADYDGDGKTDVAVFRPSNSVWYILGSTTRYGEVRFGLASDKPVPADYDNDGKTDVAVYRDGVWYILESMSGYRAVEFGMASDKPVPADYDGDGKIDIAVFSNGNWRVQGSTQSLPDVGFGLATDTPVPNVFVP